jgi:hypothetical protein
MKPTVHSESSVKRWGGTIENYLHIHDWFDQTKAHFPTNAHRAILHSSFGIFLAEQVFGHCITNSEGRNVSVRDIGEQHIYEDLGFIPTVVDYLMYLDYQPWMHGEGLPPSARKTSPMKKLEDYFKKNTLIDGSRPKNPIIFPPILDDGDDTLPKFPKTIDPPFPGPEIRD